jgi:hypothetical protein
LTGSVGPSDGDGPPIVLHGSLLAIVNAYLSPVALIALAVWVGVTRRLTIATIVIGALGSLLAFVALFDMPLRTEFSREGITRVCAVRRHRIPWSRVTGLERAPSRATRRDPRDPERLRRPGGMVARIGRRRYLLANRCEGALEYDRLVVAVRNWDDVVTVRARRPPLTTPPTHLYRRRTGRSSTVDDADR